MSRQVENEEALGAFKYCLERPTKKWIFAIIILLAIIVFGFYTFILQHIKGHVITGMRDYVVWGVYEVNFIFLLGISYSCAMLSCIFHLTRVLWGKTIMRSLELTAFISLIVAPVYILLCIGRIDRAHYLILHGRIQSPIIWDAIAIGTFIIFCFVYLYLNHVKDFARLRDLTSNANSPRWQRQLYKKLSLGFSFHPEQEKRINAARDILAAIIIPTAILAYSILAWLFGMNLRPGWNSSIIGPQFVLTAVYSGTAAVIILMWIYRKIFNLQKYFTDNHFYYLGYGLLLLTLFFGYFTFSDFITNWYNSQKNTAILLEKLLDFSQYGVHYLFSVVVTMFVTIFVIGIPKFRTVNSIFTVSVLILLGLWINRYLMIVPVLETPYVPISDVRPEYFKYSPTWVEWILTISGIATMILLMMIMTKLAPIIPVSALEEKRKFKLFGKFSF